MFKHGISQGPRTPGETQKRGTSPREPFLSSRPQKLPPIKNKQVVETPPQTHREQDGGLVKNSKTETDSKDDDELLGIATGASTVKRDDDDLFLSEDPNNNRPIRSPFTNVDPSPIPPIIEPTLGVGSLKRPQLQPSGLRNTQASKSQEFSREAPTTTIRSPCRSAGDIRRKSNNRRHEEKTSKTFVALNCKHFRLEVEKWQKTKKSYKLQEFYRAVFDSFASINATFKKSRNSIPSTSHGGRTSRSTVHDKLSDPNIQLKFVSSVYEALMLMPLEIQKLVLKGVVNCLLNEWKSEKHENDIRAYFILLLNPMFSQTSTYAVFAHLLRQVATLSPPDQTTITHWFRRLSTPRFRPIIERIHQFIQLRLFPGQSELPPMTNCGWWIPSAVKLLSFLNNANDLIKPRLVSFREFYNRSIDHIDVIAEYRQWENPASHSGFTFCQFPFILSLVSKLRILRRSQEREMIRTARDELVAFLKRRPGRPPCVSQLYLNISVRRQHLLQDSLDQVYGNRTQLKKKLKVTFIGEPAYDMGGPTKEWFLLLLRKVLAPEYNTFTYNDKSHCYWFADNGNENSADLFLVGVLMGLAVYNCIPLDIRLPLVCYRKLLLTIPRHGVVLQGPDILPLVSGANPTNHNAGSNQNGAHTTSVENGGSGGNSERPVSKSNANQNGPSRSGTNQQNGVARSGTNQQNGVARSGANDKGGSNQPNLCGVIPVTLEDYRGIDPEMARGLQELLNYEGNVEEDFGMTFQTSRVDFGVVRTIPLKPGGEHIPVTNANREEYVKAYLNHRMNKSVYRSFLAFYHGFYTVCSSNALSLLCPEELEILICGNPGFDLRDLKKHTTYKGYHSNEPTIIFFWDVLLSLPREQQKQFLLFCTGSDRVPVGGMQELNFKIVRTATAQNMLPTAYTCFNHLLLPPYGSRLQLEGKLTIAISNAEGFGLE